MGITCTTLVRFGDAMEKNFKAFLLFFSCCDFVPFFGDPSECSADVASHCRAPEKAGVRQLILILSPFAWGSPRMQG